MTAQAPTFADDLRQMLADWDGATDAQRQEALQEAERRATDAAWRSDEWQAFWGQMGEPRRDYDHRVQAPRDIRQTAAGVEGRCAECGDKAVRISIGGQFIHERSSLRPAR
jgi:hypothetical protein